MYQTPNMSLTAWDQSEDDFAHDQLVNNWLSLDTHDHSPGRGVRIPTAGLQDGSVTAAKLAVGAVTGDALADGSVGTAKLADHSVTRPKLADNSVSDTAIADAAITARMLDPNLIPLGATMMWWRPPGSNATPGGFWEAMDGRPWNHITNAWGLTSGNIPDTRGLFPQGADLLSQNGPAIGTFGGSNLVNLAHSHTISPHTHTVPAHTHGISVDGSHYHTWSVTVPRPGESPDTLLISGLDTWYRTNAFAQGLTIKDAGNTTRHNIYGSMYLKNALTLIEGNTDLDPLTTNLDFKARMDQSGEHSHGGATQASGAISTGATGGTTDPSQAWTSVTPPYVGLLMIMRVR
jgi:hypothetical protein